MPIIILQGREEKAQGIYYEFDYADEPLGVGGMGKVYKGRRIIQATKAYTDVAIKFMFDDLPESVIERARRESSIQIHNENLVEMLGFIEIEEIMASGETHQRYHVVSELLDGVRLDDLLKGIIVDRYGQPVPFAQQLQHDYLNDPYHFAIFVTRNILSGIMALHDKGYIHRDIDPTNIMITRDGKIKLIDFGIAKQLSTLNTQDRSLTTTGQFMGKADYASPELVLGDVNHQNKTTDIYAIGLMLFQFVVGHPPFEGATSEVLDMQLHKKIPLQLIRQKQLREVIAKATAKKQNDRYQSAAEFRVAVEQLENLPYPEENILAKIPSWQRIAAIGAGVLLLGGGLYWMSSRLGGNSTPDPEVLVNVDEVNTSAVAEIRSPYEEAVTLLMDSASSEQGLKLLNEIIHNRSSSDGAYLMARLLYDGNEKTDTILIMQRNLSGKLTLDNKKSHEMNVLTVELNSSSYKALYELGCDFYAGEVRTGIPNSRSTEKAVLYLNQGLASAQNAGDTLYIEKLTKRLQGLGYKPEK